jgi:predicted glycosyltransferase
MALNSTYNILMYSHDTCGLGHIRRTMAIASHLLGPRINILIFTVKQYRKGCADLKFLGIHFILGR